MSSTEGQWRRRLELQVEGAAELELEELHEAARKLPGMKTLRLALIANLALIVANFWYTRLNVHAVWSLSTLGLVGCFAVLLFAWWAPRAAARNVWAKLAREKQALRVQVNDDGITFSAGTETSTFEWRAIKRYAETPNSFLILIHRYAAQVVPKRAFSAEDLVVVRRFLRRYSSEGAKYALPRPLLLSLGLLVTALVVWQVLWSPKRRAPAPAPGIIIQLAPAPAK